MTAVMIGVDPHKVSHTAVAIGASEEPLGKLRVRACPDPGRTLVNWAGAWPERTWAVEAPAGWAPAGRQLVAAGEQVLDVPPKLGARVRLLEPGPGTRTTRTMPCPSRSRCCARGPVAGAAEDHAAGAAGMV